MKHLATVLFAVACACAALAPLVVAPPRTSNTADAFPGWPATFEGRPLTALQLTPVEQQFQKNFPGRVGRFSDGKREIIIRWVSEGTRKLHAGSDCFKAIGYDIKPHTITTRGGESWSGFSASRKGQRFDIRERIVDARGGQWTDVSAWYWAVQLGKTQGPWWAYTVAHIA